MPDCSSFAKGHCGIVDISVLLPVYNAVGTLRRAVESVLSQTGPSFELVLVDDGSTDGTSEVIDELSGDTRVKPVRIAHAGIVAALNAGIRQCRGRFIARMDADDESLPGRFISQVRYLDEHPDCGMVGCLVESESRETNEGYRRYVDWINSQVTLEEILQNRFVESPFAHPTVVFRRQLIEKYGYYNDGDFPEDYELWLRWMENGVGVAKVAEVLYRWNDPPLRLSRIDDRYGLRKFYRCKAPYLAKWVHANVRLPLWIWGAGRETRRRAEYLREYGIRIAGYIDVDPRRTGKVIGDNRPVVSYEQMPELSQAFVLVYVAKRGAREDIRHKLSFRGFLEGRDFLCCA